MPPKHQQTDDGRDSNHIASAVLNRKKLPTATSGPRRSQRTKSSLKLQKYSDIGNMKMSLSREDESDAPSDESMSDDREEEIGDSSTRKETNAIAASDDELSGSELSSVDSEIIPDAGSGLDTSSQTSERNGNKLWRILDNDQRTPMKIGVEAPNRLHLRFQNRITNKVREYKYKKINVDWSNEAHIAAVTKWRGQIFWRLKFPVRESPRWLAEEVAFLTLVYEKLALAVEKNKQVSIPNLVKIFQLFNTEFGGPRSLDSFAIQFRRKVGSRLAELKNRLDDGDSKPDGRPEYQLTVAPGEVDAYTKHKYVSLSFDTAEYQLFVNNGLAIKKATKMKQPTKKQAPRARPTQNQQSKKPAVTTGRIVKTRKPQTNGPVSITPGESKSNKTANKAAPASPDVDKPTSNRDSLAWGHVVVEESNIRIARMEPSSPTYNLVAARNAWFSTIIGPSATSETAALPVQPSVTMPTQLQNPTTLPDSRTDEGELAPQAQDWILQASFGLRDRIARLGGYIGLVNDGNRNALRANWYSDHVDVEHRAEGAPEVNALLNAAIVPPVGYRGDVRALVKNKALPTEQLHLHEQSEHALRTYHVTHDEEYDSRDSSSKNMEFDKPVSSL